MEFREGLMRLMMEEPSQKKSKSRKSKNTETKSSEAETGVARSSKWKLFQRSPSSTTTTEVQSPKKEPPSEFLCPITGSLMAEPVIVSSGHSFERSSVEACKSLDFTPVLSDSSAADFSSVIPNLALKSTIAAWCETNSGEAPRPLDPVTVDKLVREYMSSRGQSPRSEASKTEESSSHETTIASDDPLATALALRRRRTGFDTSFSSVDTTATRTETRPSPGGESSSSSSSSEVEISNPSSLFEEEDVLTKITSKQVFDVEEGLISLRQTTRTKEDSRAILCTYRLLSALRSLITSRYTGIQVNAVAALVNLSLEKSNKSKIVRSGLLPPLIDVLKGGSLEAQEHASGAIFSLALDDDNKTAIGVLGALQPLIHLLRAESDRTRHDSVLALFHLSLVQTNRSKLVRLGAVPVLLHMARSGYMTGRVLLVLGNLGLGPDGRVAMLDAGAVECMVKILSGDVAAVGSGSGSGSRSAREGCVAVLFALSHGGLRFRAVARGAGVVEALRTVEESGSERARRRARAVVEAVKGRRSDGDEVEDVNWEELLEKGFESETRSRFGSETGGPRPNPTG